MPTLKLNRSLLVLISLLPAVQAIGCREATPPAAESTGALAASPGTEWIRTELFFGLTRRDSSLIEEEKWQRFVDEQITPRFPDGLTIYHSDGQYLDTHHLLHKEPSRVVVLFYPQIEAQSASRSISAIVHAYVTQFDQETVLRVDSVQKTALLDAAATTQP